MPRGWIFGSSLVALCGCLGIAGLDGDYVEGRPTSGAGISQGGGSSSTAGGASGGASGSAGGGNVGSGAMGGSAASTGAAGSGGSSCNPTSEACNGMDDDCDTVVDDGCPTDVVLANGGFATHMQAGNLGGGNPFSDVCANGSAIYRFSGRVGGNIDEIRAHCAPLLLSVDTGNMPYAYAITRGADQPLAVHGQNQTTAFDVACLANEYVVGIDGVASSGGVHDLTIHCAELLITGAPGSFAVSYGTVTTYLIDGSGSGTAFSDLLAAPKVVDRYRGRSGAWVDSIGVGDATLEVVVQP